jgi:hypothetical protein
MQEARDVIGREGQQFAAPEPDKQIVEFTLNAQGVGGSGSFSESAGAFAKRRGITRQGGESMQQMRVRRGNQQTPKQRE